MKSVPTEPDEHVEALLPWYVNGTLDPIERARVDQHLAHCQPCRASCELETQLARLLRTSRDSPELHPQAGWMQLSAQLSRADQASQTQGESPSVPAPRAATKDSAPQQAPQQRPFLTFVVLAQAAAIAALGFLLLHLITGREDANYRTLTQPDTALNPATPAVRVVFADQTSAARVHELLQHVGGVIRSGPSSAGVYTIELTKPQGATPAVKDAVVAADWLRAQTGVLFAEPLGVPPSD